MVGKIKHTRLNTSKGKQHHNFIISSICLVTNPLEIHTYMAIYHVIYDCQSFDVSGSKSQGIKQTEFSPLSSVT